MGLFRKKKKPQYVEEILEFGEEIDLRYYSTEVPAELQEMAFSGFI